MFVRLRQMVERQIVEAVVDAALAKKLLITVNDGEEDVLVESTKRSDILDKMYDTDEARLSFSKSSSKAANLGWVYFIYGNSGTDVMNDHSLDDDTKEIVKAGDCVADYWEAEGTWQEFDDFEKGWWEARKK